MKSVKMMDVRQSQASVNTSMMNSQDMTLDDVEIRRSIEGNLLQQQKLMNKMYAQHQNQLSMVVNFNSTAIHPNSAAQFVNDTHISVRFQEVGKSDF